MESQHNSSDGVLKTRPVLTDVSNLPPKRPFSLISGDDGVDNLVKKKCQFQFGSHNSKDNDNALLQPKGINPCFKIPFCSDSSLHDVSCQEQTIPRGASEERNETRVGFGEKGQERAPNDEGFVDLATESDGRDLYVVENLGPPKCVGVAARPPLFPRSGDSKFLGLERCAGLKSHGGANMAVDAASAANLLKSCACSFCTKAGHMLSDLHYQDAKSRLTAVRKSQKEARTVLQKISGLKDTHTIIHNQQDCPDPSNLESALTHQWKSLFAFMENKYTQEINQRESELQKLKDLKEKCKNDLELTDKSIFDYQQNSDVFYDCKIASHTSPLVSSFN